jgi:diguanylate cyclase (GGDEF)-like protein
MPQYNTKFLELISNETKDSIMSMPVVTPSVYASIFSKYAIEHNVDLDDEAKLSHDLIISECSNLTKLQKQTSKSVQQLSHNTDRAINAIKNNDESVLNEVLAQTQELRQEILKLKEAVYKDELTHIYNRKWLHDNLLEENGDSLKYDGTLAMIDLNYFKIINDTYGHIIGDKVLIFIAAQLTKTKQSVVRYGGDEFIVIFRTDTDLNEAVNLLNKLRENIISKKLKTGDASFKVSFSIGAHEFKKGDKLSEIIELADKNMYDDKIEIKKRVTGI